MTSAVITTIALLLVALAWTYNRLVAERNQARQGFADIDVQLKRRADLVPQLVEAVRGCAAYEKPLLTSVTELCASAAGAARLAERFEHERATAPCSST
jgi:LemA protein